METLSDGKDVDVKQEGPADTFVNVHDVVLDESRPMSLANSADRRTQKRRETLKVGADTGKGPCGVVCPLSVLISW